MNIVSSLLVDLTRYGCLHTRTCGPTDRKTSLQWIVTDEAQRLFAQQLIIPQDSANTGQLMEDNGLHSSIIPS